MPKSAILEAMADYSREAYQRVWHGSGAEFDKFSNAHIGTGEGAQAYGMGHYVSRQEEIGRFYKEQQSEKEIVYRGEVLTGQPNDLHEGVYEFIDNAEDMDEAREAIQDSLYRDRITLQDAQKLDDISGKMSDDTQYYMQQVDDLETIALQLDDIEINTKGSLYEVDVPSESTMWDWDKPLSEQPEVLEAIDSDTEDWMRGEYESLGLNSPWDAPEEFTGKELYRQIAREDGADAASKIFEDAGFTGHKFSGGRLAGGEGKRAENMVVYDESALEIAKRYGIPLTMATAVLAGTMTPEEAQAGPAKFGREAFDTAKTYYHGTSRLPDEITNKQPLFLTDDTEIAESFATGGYDEEIEDAVLMPFNVRKNMNIAQTEDVIQAIKEVRPEVDPKDIDPDNLWIWIDADSQYASYGGGGKATNQGVIDNLKDKGFDSASFYDHNLYGNDGGPNLMVFEPADQIKGKFAKFEGPGVMGAGVLGAGVLAPEEAQAGAGKFGRGSFDTAKTYYHGRHGDFEEFDPKALNPESHMGKAVYTTDNPAEASGTYAWNRLDGTEMSADMELAIDKHAMKKFNKQHDTNFESWDDIDLEGDWDDEWDTAWRSAEKELTDSPNVMPLVTRKNANVLDLTKPLPRDEAEKIVDKIIEDYKQDYTAKGITDDFTWLENNRKLILDESYGDELDPDQFLLNLENISMSDQTQEVLKDLGYDGVEYKPLERWEEGVNLSDTKHRVMFNPDDVKGKFAKFEGPGLMGGAAGAGALMDSEPASAGEIAGAAAGDIEGMNQWMRDNSWLMRNSMLMDAFTPRPTPEGTGELLRYIEKADERESMGKDRYDWLRLLERGAGTMMDYM